jgi:hypothetical protein
MAGTTMTDLFGTRRAPMTMTPVPWGVSGGRIRLVRTDLPSCGH